MTPNRAPLLAALALACVIAVLVIGWAARTLQTARRVVAAQPVPAAPGVSKILVQEPGELARLRDPAGSAAEDALIIAGWVSSLLDAHPADARPPLGTNADFARLLTGSDGRGPVWIPAGDPLIAGGELRDRFGSPYHFHPDSSARVTVRGAGPDRRLFTADDVVAP